MCHTLRPPPKSLIFPHTLPACGILTPDKLTMDQSKKVLEENRVFHSVWTYSFAFIADDAGLPVCLIRGGNKHTAFAEKRL